MLIYVKTAYSLVAENFKNDRVCSNLMRSDKSAASLSFSPKKFGLGLEASY